MMTGERNTLDARTIVRRAVCWLTVDSSSDFSRLKSFSSILSAVGPRLVMADIVESLISTAESRELNAGN